MDCKLDKTQQKAQTLTSLETEGMNINITEKHQKAKLKKFNSLLKDSFLNNTISSGSAVNYDELKPINEKNNERTIYKHSDIFKNLIEMVKSNECEKNKVIPNDNENQHEPRTPFFLSVEKNDNMNLIDIPVLTSDLDTIEITQNNIDDNSLETLCTTGRITKLVTDSLSEELINIEERTFEEQIQRTLNGLASNQPIDSIKDIKASNQHISLKDKKYNLLALIKDDKKSIKLNFNDYLLPKIKTAIDNAPYNHLIFTPNTKITQIEFYRYLMKIRKGLLYCLKNLSQPSLHFLETKKILLPGISSFWLNLLLEHMKILILDLDETLIFSSSTKIDCDFIIGLLNDQKSQKSNVYVKIRPYAQEMLKILSKKYDIIVFTASTELYALSVINILDPKREYIKHVLTRNHCLMTKNGFYIKDLRILMNIDINNIIIIDDFVHSFGFQLGNGVPIYEFRGDKDDDELRYLTRYLLKINKVDNILQSNINHLKLIDLLKQDFFEFENSA